MATGWTNRGKLRMLDLFFRDATPTDNFFVALCTITNTPSPDTNVLGELEEICSGNGYNSGGTLVARSDIGFPAENEDDDADKSSVTMRNVFFPTSGGKIPAMGKGIKWAILTDANASVSSREVYAYAEFSGDAKIVADTRVLSILGLKFSLKEPT